MASKRTTLSLLRRLVAPLLILLLLAGLFTNTVHAATINSSFDGTLVITGETLGEFRLRSSSTQLFRLQGVLPGDSWFGRIRLQNDTNDLIEVALLYIENQLRDSTLFNALTLDLCTNGSSIYSGPYATSSPVTPYFLLKPGESITLDVRVTLPKEVGNEAMNRRMESDWVFEAHYFGDEDCDCGCGDQDHCDCDTDDNPDCGCDCDPDGVCDCDDGSTTPKSPSDNTSGKDPNTPPQTGVELILETVRDSTILWIILLAAAAAAIAAFKVHRTKRVLAQNERSHADCESEEEN